VPSRIVEFTSYHLILGCVAVGMGVALLPDSVLAGYAGRDRLSVHPLPPRLSRATTRLVWRRASPQAKISALAEILLDDRAHSTGDVPGTKRGRQVRGKSTV